MRLFENALKGTRFRSAVLLIVPVVLTVIKPVGGTAFLEWCGMWQDEKPSPISLKQRPHAIILVGGGNDLL